MPPRLLIIPASIRSHVLPSLYLADVLAKMYEVIYAVTSEILVNIVEKNGYETRLISEYKPCIGAETAFIINHKKEKATTFNLVKAYLKHEVFHHRQLELKQLIDDIRPEVIIIDVYSSTDFLILYAHIQSIKLCFFNPMPSTYRVEKYPIVSENYWPKNIQVPKDKKITIKQALKKPLSTLLDYLAQSELQRLQKMVKISKKYQVVPNDFTIAFNNIPEFILAPLSFEFSPTICKPYQYYLGLCQREHRIDTELDTKFEECWPNIIAQKQAGNKLIYCSFGTFYERADATLLRFVKDLVTVLNDIPNTILICTTNKYVIETLHAQKMINSRTHFFSRVPQMQVLSKADVFVTHGGLGSIKEAIYYSIPMLVYPLDPRYDQNGNALKVEHHGLGLRGRFVHERTSDLQNKIEQLLTMPIFKHNVEKIRTTIFKHYTKEFLENQMKECLNQKSNLTLNFQINDK